MSKFSWFKSNTFHPSYYNKKNDYILILLSHLANIVPIVIAIILKLPYWYLLIILFQTIFSILYHSYFKNNLLRLVDWVFATSLIISNIIIFILHKGSYLKFFILIILIIAGFKYFLSFKNYAYNHSIWHIFAATITSIVEL